MRKNKKIHQFDLSLNLPTYLKINLLFILVEIPFKNPFQYLSSLLLDTPLIYKYTYLLNIKK